MASEKKENLRRAKKINILILGLGGGGGRIVSQIAQKIKGSSFVAIDTDSVQLEKVQSQALKAILLGEKSTQGLGTGGNINLAKEAAQEAKKEIDHLLKGVDLVVFVSCLGGGAGSGIFPVVAQAARSSKILSLGIVTFPFQFEGRKKQKIAQKTLQEIVPYLDCYLIISNEKIFNLVKGGTFQEAFNLINAHIVNWLESLINIIKEPGLINIDFADLKTILKSKEKKLFLNRVETAGEHRLEKIQKEIEKDPLASFPLERVKKILFYVRGGSDLKMSEVEAISQKIKGFNPAAKIIFGLDKEKELKEKIEVTLLALMGEKPQSKKKLERKKKSQPSKKKKKPKAKRRNALEIKKESRKKELEKTPQEQEWEIPAFLRRK
jgi:cell division protein FtsZ